MKKLNEVIAEMEYEAEYNSGEQRSYDADALHYLKTYQANQHAYEENSRKAEEARERYQEAVKNCELAENKYKRLCEETSQNFAVTSQNDPDGDHQQLLKCRALLQDFYRNDPLDWGELREMIGKPVWVENQFYKRWLIAYKVNREDIIFDGNGFYTQAFSVDYGKAWQAYRKERN